MRIQQTGFSLVATLMVVAVSGCSQSPTEEVAKPSQQTTEVVVDKGDVGSLSLEQRLVFMSGHVEAGLALYRAGDAQAAAPHLLHPVSETHASERAGLDQLGFDSSLFERVSDALNADLAASQVEPQLQAAETNLLKVRTRAGGDAKAQIRFLIETAMEEYRIAVPEDAVSDEGEYHDAWGFLVVATKLTDGLESANASQVKSKLEEMLSLWPDPAPSVTDDPTSQEDFLVLAKEALSLLDA